MRIYEVLQSGMLKEKLCEIMKLDPATVASMAIYLDADEPVRIFVTLLAEKKMMNADFAAFSKAAEVKEVKE